MAQFETWIRASLQQPPQVQVLHGTTFSQDNMANRVGVIVLDGNAAATLSGNVTGYIIRQDGDTVLVNGSLDGNRAYIDLPESAYAVPGQIQIAIRLTDGNTKTVLGAMTAYVQRTATGTIIDPGHVIPDIDELLAQIEACEEATDAANTAATNANNAASYVAPVEASGTASRAYEAGGYLIYNGVLYQALTAIASGAALTVGTNIAAVSGGLGNNLIAATVAEVTTYLEIVE